MGEFEITGSRILGLAEQISSCGQEVKRQEGRAADILRQVRFQETDYRGLEQALSGITESLHRQQECIMQYGGILEHIAKAYESTEDGILEADVPADRNLASGSI